MRDTEEMVISAPSHLVIGDLANLNPWQHIDKKLHAHFRTKTLVHEDHDVFQR